ncbi:MAG: hypothetical protein AAF619_13700 [Pseudomonadota bacterium]
MTATTPTPEEIAAEIRDAKTNLETALGNAFIALVEAQYFGFHENAIRAACLAKTRQNEISYPDVELQFLIKVLEEISPPPISEPLAPDHMWDDARAANAARMATSGDTDRFNTFLESASAQDRAARPLRSYAGVNRGDG